MSKLHTILALAGVALLTPPLFGQSVEAVAEREIARRQEKAEYADTLIANGKRAMSQRDYEEAFSQFRGAVDALPESSATHWQRKSALGLLTDAAVKLAEQRIAEGRFDSARKVCDTILINYDPKCTPVLSLVAKLEDPEYFNQTITPGFVAKVEDVKRLLAEADGFVKTGRYDMAMKRTDQVLNLDPYNIAARKIQEEVNKLRDDYAVNAYNETRSRAIWQVDNAWQSPVRKFETRDSGGPGSGNIPVQDTKRIEDKLARIILSKVDLKDVTVREAIDYLRQKSREMDTTESDPTKRGVNIVPKLEGSSLPAAPAGGATGGFGEAAAIPGLTDTTAAVPAPDANLAAAVNPNDIRITLNLMSVPLGEVLRYVCQQAGLKIKIDPYAVNIVPLSEPTDTLYTKEYKVQPGFIGKSASAGSTDTAVPGDATRGGTGLAARSGAREFLESNGVTFPPGSAANFLPSSSKLIVRNTQANLELVDALVEADKGNVPSQVEIESKFIEITQNNAKELGFDWMLGQANVPGNQSVFFGGGVQGVAPTINTADWPFVPPGADLPVGQNPITGGNRSGNYAITQNAIDALLFGLAGNSLKGTGVFSLAGVFTDPQFQLVIRALNQKKGVDLLSSPRVTTKSGQPATIEIIREFIYPTEFDPPEIPQNIGGGSSGFGESAAIQTFPVTPTTPTSFETRNTGVTLEVEPVVGPDGYTIDLNLLPQVVEFEGFINYGSPISTVNPAALGVGGAIAQLAGQPSSVVLTDNVINQPIFSTRKVKTSVSIWDGSTVVLGGLMREDVQKVEDKVPLLGDIPLVGRFFRSDVDQHLKRNLVIFVTARLINPAGDPVNGMNDDEEEVDEVPVPDAPPGLPAPEATGFFK